MTSTAAGSAQYIEFRRNLTAEWGHCDPAGIIFHPRFLEYFDWNTALLFEAATGLSKARMQREIGLGGIPVVETQVRFLRPVAFGDAMEVVSTFSALGKSSFQLRHTVLVNGEVCVECSQSRVWCVPDPKNPQQLKSQPIPAEVVSKLTRG
jgi:4-hydroxybenzoyl-CoA thioesterase